MITTVLYDMDGLLLDTEPIWGEVMMDVAARNGIEITLQQLKETTGLRIFEVTEYWARNFPWSGKSSGAVAEEILDEVIIQSLERGGILPGVIQSLEQLKASGYRLGLASSSPARMIMSLTEAYNLMPYFDCITSADAVDFGKPHPAVFLHCAGSMGAVAHECCVLEDSVNGVIAGKAARMKAIAVPAAQHYEDPRFAIADLKLRSLEEFSVDMLQTL